MEAADETHLLAGSVAFAGGRIDQTAAAMGADIIIGFDRVRRGADDQEAVFQYVVGDIVADVRNILDPARLKPCLAPQLVLLGARIFRGDIGLYPDGDRLFQFFCGFYDLANVRHIILVFSTVSL